MFEISNLTKCYAGNDIKAVDSLSVKVENGKIYGFLGPNGAGKSTTIKCMVGVLPYKIGKISLDNISLEDKPIAFKQNIGYVPDNHNVYEKLSGMEYINFMADIYKVSTADRKARADRFIEMFKLNNAINNQIKTYSHGMKQKICVIGAILHNPKLWVLDEPLTGLDPESAFDLKKLMREHCDEGNSVLFSSHVLDVVEKVCDKIGIINNGKLVLECDMDSLKEKKNDQTLEQLFLSITRGNSNA